MCTLALALTGLTTGLQMAGTYQQSRAQAAAYEAQAQAAQQQADAAYQNAKIQNKKGEIMAEQYARQQRDLDARRKLIVGQQTAAAGASGIAGNVGSPLDVYTASMDAWKQDTMNLLNSQRNDEWGNYVNEVNYVNQGNAYTAQSSNLREQASAAKTAGNISMFGTLLGTASSMAGMKSGGSSEPNAWYGGSQDGGAGYLTGNAALKAGNKVFGNMKINSKMPSWAGSHNYYG